MEYAATVKAIRTVVGKNGKNVNVLSLSLPVEYLPLADAKGLVNVSTDDMTGEEFIHRPDVTLCVSDAYKVAIEEKLADGKTLSLACREDLDDLVVNRAKNYFVPAETILADAKHLSFVVSSAPGISFEE